MHKMVTTWTVSRE